MLQRLGAYRKRFPRLWALARMVKRGRLSSKDSSTAESLQAGKPGFRDIQAPETR